MMQLSRSGIAFTAVMLSFVGSAAAAPKVYVESAMVKVLPRRAPKEGLTVNLIAARNEFVSFQVVVHGGDAGANKVEAWMGGFEGPTSIPATDLTLYRVAFLDINAPTPPNTETGAWPDPLVPNIDEITGEKRNAFPMTVPANESRSIWADIHVPAEARPGNYSGKVEVWGQGFSATVNVNLQVVRAYLPSTPSLGSAFLIFGSNVCVAHGFEADCSDEMYGSNPALLARYEKMALEHRMTLANPFYTVPTNWSAFDERHAPFLDGTVDVRLPGARMTTAMFPVNNYLRDRPEYQEAVKAGYAAFTKHFKERGWLDRAFDYTADEPGFGGMEFSTALARAKFVRSAAPELRTLVTTSYQRAQEHGLLSDVDILVPVVNWMDGVQEPYVGSQRSHYDAFVNSRKDVWMYQSCMSQGCADGSLPYAEADHWPSYMVDASAARNRAMQWVSFKERISTELYYQTAQSLPNAWWNQRAYNGNGEGNLFYPGTPSMIGGTTNVPVASIRMKMIRLGMQDYEWLKMVSESGDPDFARETARALFNRAHTVPDDGALFEKARAALIARVLELGPTPLYQDAATSQHISPSLRSGERGSTTLAAATASCQQAPFGQSALAVALMCLFLARRARGVKS